MIRRQGARMLPMPFNHVYQRYLNGISVIEQRGVAGTGTEVPAMPTLQRQPPIRLVRAASFEDLTGRRYRGAVKAIHRRDLVCDKVRIRQPLKIRFNLHQMSKGIPRIFHTHLKVNQMIYTKTFFCYVACPVRLTAGITDGPTDR